MLLKWFLAVNASVSQQWPPGRSGARYPDLHGVRATVRPGVVRDRGQRHWKTEVVVSSLEMLSGRSKKEYAQEAQAVADAPHGAPAANGATSENDLEAVVAM